MTSQTLQENSPWARLPADRQTCSRTGFSRATLYRLLHRAGGKIKTVNLKAEGKSKGRRLFHVGSLLAYLDRLAATQKRQEART